MMCFRFFSLRGIHEYEIYKTNIYVQVIVHIENNSAHENNISIVKWYLTM